MLDSEKQMIHAKWITATQVAGKIVSVIAMERSWRAGEAARAVVEIRDKILAGLEDEDEDEDYEDDE